MSKKAQEWNGKPGKPAKFASPPGGDGGRINVSKMQVREFTSRTALQTTAIKMLQEKDVVFLIGPAGTSKTYLGAKMAIDLLKSREVDKILATRPAVEAGESVGFLTGDLAAKMAPYLKPIFENLAHFVGKGVVDQLIKNELIELSSMTYIRGRTFHRTVMLLDEMQNATPEQLRMCLTRIGEDTLVVVTMDPEQIDLPEDKVSACEDLWMFENERNIGIIRFGDKDVVRSEGAKMINRCYRKTR